MAHAGKVFCGCGVAAGSFLAVSDYHQEIEQPEQYTCRNTDHLGRTLQRIHTVALLETLSFSDIRVDGDCCDEIKFLSTKAAEKKKEIEAILIDKSPEQIEETVVKRYRELAVRLCRRGLIRNGYYGYWGMCVIQDKAVQFLLLPAAGFLGPRVFNFVMGRSAAVTAVTSAPK